MWWQAAKVSEAKLAAFKLEEVVYEAPALQKLTVVILKAEFSPEQVLTALMQRMLRMPANIPRERLLPVPATVLRGRLYQVSLRVLTRALVPATALRDRPYQVPLRVLTRALTLRQGAKNSAHG
jgi:hypothetical protein